MVERKIGRVAVTTDGIEAPLLEGRDHIMEQIFLNRPGIEFVVFAAPFLTGLVGLSVSKEEKKQLKTQLEFVGALVTIGRDVAKGRIAGRIVPANDPTLKKPTWGEVEPKLEAFLEGRKRSKL